MGYGIRGSGERLLVSFRRVSQYYRGCMTRLCGEGHLNGGVDGHGDGKGRQRKKAYAETSG
jgi:hypothetical protein